MAVTYTQPNTFLAGRHLMDGSTVNKTIGEPPYSQSTGFVALAGGGQTGATQLLGTIARVDTVATAADSVMLPASGTGKPIVVINNTATSMQVFGQAGDTINGVATGTGVAQAAGKTALYVSPAAGVWFRLLSA
jgi:hypothetical protein